MRLDRPATVSCDLARARAGRELLGFAAGRPQAVSEQYPAAVRGHRHGPVALRAGVGPVLWLMQPVGDEGPPAHPLARRGPGLHHRGLATDHGDADAARRDAGGLDFVREPHPAHGDREIRARRDGEGVRVELVQALPRAPRQRG
jgi:hypothetical protein